MRSCDVCGSAMTSRVTTRDNPYAYKIGGLPHVGLVGIDVNRCPTCDVDAPIIPKPGELHRVLVRLFLHKPDPLVGDELRFLRKHAGLSALDFAKHLAIDPSHLSRVENGKTPSLGATTDRLARAIVASKIDARLFKSILDRMAQDGAPVRRPLARWGDASKGTLHRGRDMKNNRWSAEQAA